MTAAPEAALPIGPARPFWEALLQGRLRIQRCAKCHRWSWPPQPRCGACGSWEMEWPEVPLRGEVHCFTHTHHPFTPETRGKTPFVNLLVALPDAGGARLLGILEGSEEGLAVGSAVRGHILPPGEGRDLPALRWQLDRGDR